MVTAQVTIGSGIVPASYCLLKLDTQNVSGGLRLPQLQGAAISNFKALVEADATVAGKKDYVEGLLFYNMDTHCIEFWSGTVWQYICGDSIKIRMLRDSVHTLQQQINELETRITYIEDFTQLSDITDYVVNQSVFPGLGISSIRTGHTYNFWGTGSLSTGMSLTNGITYRLITGGVPNNPALGISEALTYYKGAPTVGTLWVDNVSGGNRVFSMPIYFDGSGIYIIPTSNMNFNAGATFNFTQSLILVE